MPNWKKVVTSGSNAELNQLKLSDIVNAGTDTDKFLVLDSTGNVDFRTGAQVLSDIGGQGNSPGTVSSSAQISGYNTFLEITGDNVISSSIQVNADSITNFDTNVKDKLNADGVISSSAQLTTEFDTRYLNTTGDSVISSSVQVNADSITNFDTNVKDKLNADGVISSSNQLTSTFDTRYLNTTGDNVISSSTQVTISSTTGYTTFSSSIATDITALNGAGYIDGVGVNEYIPRFTDSNTVTSSQELRTNTSNYLAINGHSAAWNLASFAPVAPLTVRNGTDQGSGQPNHGISYFQVPNNRAGYLQFANGTFSTFTGMDTNGDYYIGFGNATDRTFRFVNNGVGGVPSLSLGTLTISGSGTLKNIGPAQFSGSVSITTADQVAATTDTDKFVVIDGQQLKYRSGTQVLSDIDGVSVSGTQTITGVKTFSSNTTFNGNLTVGGTITAQQFNTELVSSSIIYQSGSTKFGDTSDDTHNFTGSINVNGEINIWNVNDPKVTLTTQNGDTYSLGVDDSDADKFKISRSTAVGTNPIYTYNYNGGNPQTLIQGDLAIPSATGFTGGQLVKINSSGFLVPAVANTDYIPTGSTPDIYVITPVQTYVDFKSLSTGGLPWGNTVDLMPIDRWMGVWIAPSAGYIDKIFVSPENINTTQDQFSIQMYNNGGGQGTPQSQLAGGPGSNLEYTFGSTNYSFAKNDRIHLFLDKGTNTCDFYAVQVVFRLNN